MKSRIKKTLRNIVLTGASLAGIVGLAGIGGCATEEEAIFGKVLGVGMQASPHASINEETLGAMIDVGSQASLNSINAEKMETDVNVNVYGGHGESISIEEGFKGPVNLQNYNIDQNQTKRRWPLVFTFKKELSPGVFDYEKIFHSGEKINVYGNLSDDFPEGTPVANQTIYSKGGVSSWVIKRSPVQKNRFKHVRFDATHLAENIGEGEYENIWYVKLNGQWKEVGRVRYAVFK